MNKPLVSYVLASFGFTPMNRGGRVVSISSATRLRDCKSIHADPRRAHVHTKFQAPSDVAQLSIEVNHQLQGTLDLPSPLEVRRALTLRGGQAIELLDGKPSA